MIPGQRLPVARYRFQFRALDPIYLPEFAGPVLRSVLGDSLRRAVCSTGQPTCKSCSLLPRCAYPRLFEPTVSRDQALHGVDLPRPFVIEPPPMGTELIQRGEILSIGLVLFGQAQQECHLFVKALRAAFANRGVGIHGRRGRAELQDVLREEGSQEVSIWEHLDNSIFPWTGHLLVPSFRGIRSAYIKLLTPMALKHRGNVLKPHELNARVLLKSITQRAKELLALHAGINDLADDSRDLLNLADRLEQEHHLISYRTRRYSARQHQSYPIEGVMGDWTLRGDLTEVARWLWLGQWLHVGRTTVMGQGRYELTLS